MNVSSLGKQSWGWEAQGRCSDVGFTDPQKEILLCAGHKQAFTSDQNQISPLFLSQIKDWCAATTSGNTPDFRLRDVHHGPWGTPV